MGGPDGGIGPEPPGLVCARGRPAEHMHGHQDVARSDADGADLQRAWICDSILGAEQALLDPGALREIEDVGPDGAEELPAVMQGHHLAGHGLPPLPHLDLRLLGEPRGAVLLVEVLVGEGARPDDPVGRGRLHVRGSAMVGRVALIRHVGDVIRAEREDVRLLQARDRRQVLLQGAQQVGPGLWHVKLIHLPEAVVEGPGFVALGHELIHAPARRCLRVGEGMAVALLHLLGGPRAAQGPDLLLQPRHALLDDLPPDLGGGLPGALTGGFVARLRVRLDLDDRPVAGLDPQPAAHGELLPHGLRDLGGELEPVGGPKLLLLGLAAFLLLRIELLDRPAPPVFTNPGLPGHDVLDMGEVRLHVAPQLLPDDEQLTHPEPAKHSHRAWELRSGGSGRREEHAAPQDPPPQQLRREAQQLLGPRMTQLHLEPGDGFIFRLESKLREHGGGGLAQRGDATGREPETRQGIRRADANHLPLPGRKPRRLRHRE
ncbi:hypothetical protein COEX109129_33630 [Corallococcus exiguus]